MGKIAIAMVVSALVLAVPAPVAARQVPAQPATTPDQVALRQALEQVVVLLRQLVDQSSRRDSMTILLSRIELAERRLAPIEADLRALRQRRLTEETEQAQLQASFKSIDNMQKMDVTGGAREMFDAERLRTTASVEQKAAVIAEIDQQIWALTADIAERQRAIATMEAQFASLLAAR
jgi:hypothetical protein